MEKLLTGLKVTVGRAVEDEEELRKQKEAERTALEGSEENGEDVTEGNGKAGQSASGSPQRPESGATKGESEEKESGSEAPKEVVEVNVSLQLFGSSANGFGSKNGDVDMCALITQAQGNGPSLLASADEAHRLGQLGSQIQVVREGDQFKMFPGPEALGYLYPEQCGISAADVISSAADVIAKAGYEIVSFEARHCCCIREE